MGNYSGQPALNTSLTKMPIITLAAPARMMNPLNQTHHILLCPLPSAATTMMLIHAAVDQTAVMVIVPPLIHSIHQEIY